MPLSPQAVQFSCLWRQDFDRHGESLSQARYVTIVFLSITTQVDAQYLAIFHAVYKASHAVGKTGGIYPACAGTSTLREDQDVLPSPQEIEALFQNAFHFFPVSAATNRDTLRQIAYQGGEDVALKICPFGQIPGKNPVVKHVGMHRGHGIGEDSRIYISQVVGADYPGAGMVSEEQRALPANLLQVPYPVAKKPYAKVYSRRRE